MGTSPTVQDLQQQLLTSRTQRAAYKQQAEDLAAELAKVQAQHQAATSQARVQHKEGLKLHHQRSKAALADHVNALAAAQLELANSKAELKAKTQVSVCSCYRVPHQQHLALPDMSASWWQHCLLLSLHCLHVTYLLAASMLG